MDMLMKLGVEDVEVEVASTSTCARNGLSVVCGEVALFGRVLVQYLQRCRPAVDVGSLLGDISMCP